jgi:hypothetical protein
MGSPLACERSCVSRGLPHASLRFAQGRGADEGVRPYIKLEFSDA